MNTRLVLFTIAGGLIALATGIGTMACIKNRHEILYRLHNTKKA